MPITMKIIATPTNIRPITILANFFIDNKKVVKYFSDETKCKNRIKRVSTLQKLTPSITELTPNMFGYDFIDGKLLSEAEKEELMGTLQDTVTDLQKESDKIDNIKEKTTFKIN